MISNGIPGSQFGLFQRVMRAVAVVALVLYTLVAAGALVYTGWPPLHARFGALDLVGFFGATILGAIIGGLFTDVMPRSIRCWLLVAVAAAGTGLANYERFFHRYGGTPGWTLVALISLSELIGMCAPAPILTRLLGISPATSDPAPAPFTSREGVTP